jgi:hypothetical protein
MNEMQFLQSRVDRLEKQFDIVENLLKNIDPLMKIQQRALTDLAQQIASTPGCIELLMKHKYDTT